MGNSRVSESRTERKRSWHQIMWGVLFIIVSISSLSIFYLSRIFQQNKGNCIHSKGLSDANKPAEDIVATARLKQVLEEVERLQAKLESNVQRMEESPQKLHSNAMSGSEFKKFLENEVIGPLYSAYIALMKIQAIIEENKNTTLGKEPPIYSFVSEELKKYITPKENRAGKINLYGIEKMYSTMGYGCVSLKKELDEYMNYEIGSYCKDDWILGQRLMVHGCDPLPRRRCLARASRLYLKPYSVNESLWRMPDGKNVRWSNYQCKNFECLASSNNTNHDYSQCKGCFDMESEKLKWITYTSQTIDFVINDVLAFKPGEIRIGLDFSIGTGTFAARMREQGVTIVLMAVNLGAPFHEMIALRGLIPLYVTLNQRLPFFDNTMDLIHTNQALNGWIDLQSLDFVMFDLDRVLRPGGLLWIDRFYCKRKDLDEYLFLFLQFGYRKRMWAVAPKSKDEVYLSGLLEKPQRG